MEIPKTYDPKNVEDKWYQIWTDNGYFKADAHTTRKPYTIVIPPPNVTAVLHMGHAYNNTIQDIYIRYKRKNGFETLWQPGTDHAGIATQNAVEKHLAKEKITRQQLGREKFVEKVWEWRQKYGSTIIHQLKKLGCSCDWEKERFTMDDGLSNAVKEVFVRLYEKKLIYKGKYIINWCPRCSTAISDEEVEHKETHGHLWYFRYPLKNGEGYVTVATTRPETMLGDTAVAVNPNDDRFKKLVGEIVILPFVDREIPIITDDTVDPEFGTGSVKVTPAHDPNDFQIGRRHDLPEIVVMDTAAVMNENAAKFKGTDRFTARNMVVQEMEKLQLMEKVESHHHSVGHCHRCNTVVEPYVSEQWFVKVAPLAKPALDVVKNGQVKLHPHERWFKTYEHWMENVRDWCISRQLWWGHRIPVYYCQDCDEMIVARDKPSTCTNCNSSNIRQDEDVLDTWFSSWLWPFSTLGWPENTKNLQYFYPTDLLVTGPDIIFFWVARMIMAGLEFMDQVPFKDVLLNGIVRDEHGRKMSKSLGNGIDPLEMIGEYSSDAVRFTLVMMSSEGQDINLSRKHFEMGRNFSNKIWNAYRFLKMNITESDTDYEIHASSFELADKWILSRFFKTVQELNTNLDKFRVNESLNSIYQFFWHDYCDWYLELIKQRLYGNDDEAKKTALSVATFLMKETMNLLHPFVPFLSEEIWQTFKSDLEESIVISKWTEVNTRWIDEDSESAMIMIQDAISAIRNIRAEMNVPPAKPAPLYILADNEKTDLILKNTQYFKSLAKVEEIGSYDQLDKNELKASAVIHNIELFIPLAELIDLDKEKERLNKEIDRVKSFINSTQKKLANKNFIEKAPEHIVRVEKEKMETNQEKLVKLEKNLKNLTGK